MTTIRELVEQAFHRVLSEETKIVSKKVETHAYDAAHADADEFRKYVHDTHGVHARLHYHGKPGAYNHEVTHITYTGHPDKVKNAVEEHHEVESIHKDDYDHDEYHHDVVKPRKEFLKTKSHPDVEKMNDHEAKLEAAYKAKHK